MMYTNHALSSFSDDDSTISTPNDGCHKLQGRSGSVKKGSKFKATALWNDLMDYVRRNVRLKDKRHAKKDYQPCFNGNDLCETVLLYLLMDSENFNSTEITREKAAKLCQVLMDSSLFEPLPPGRKGKFEPSSQKYYTFVMNSEIADITQQKPLRTQSAPEFLSQPDQQYRIRCCCEPELIDGVISNPCTTTSGRSSCSCQSSARESNNTSLPGASLSRSTGRFSATRKRPSMRGTNNQVDQSVQKLARITGNEKFGPSALWNMTQDVALAQLSQIVDVPFLEGLIHSNQEQKSDTLCYDNDVFRDPTMMYRFSDAWVDSANDVLVHTSKAAPDYDGDILTYRSLLYKVILKYYRGRSTPLLPVSHEPVHLAILNLLYSGAEKQALLAIRLSGILLPNAALTEIASLLTFLNVVIQTEAPKLRSHQMNAAAVMSDYSGVFFMNSKLLSSDQRALLLKHLLANSSELTSVPDCVQSVVDESIQQLKRGGDPIPAVGTLYCNKLTSPQYDEQTISYTEESIVRLVKDITDNTKLSLKEKEKYLQQFHKLHPSIMNKHFSGLS